MYLGSELKRLESLEVDLDVIETNMFRFKFKKGFKKFKHDEFANMMRDDHGILMNYGHKNEAIRLVTHRDISREQIDQALKIFKKHLD